MWVILSAIHSPLLSFNHGASSQLVGALTARFPRKETTLPSHVSVEVRLDFLDHCVKTLAIYKTTNEAAAMSGKRAHDFVGCSGTGIEAIDCGISFSGRGHFDKAMKLKAERILLLHVNDNMRLG
jgi:hypothetical protein